MIGDEWIAGNLSYHLKQRPKWNNISKNTMLLNGGFVIVNHPDLNCKSSFFPIFKSIKIDYNGISNCFVMYRNKK